MLRSVFRVGPPVGRRPKEFPCTASRGCRETASDRRCATPRALVLDAAGFEAEYVHGDIGWEFWRQEGEALPERTVDLLRSTDCAFFGAITSKPAADAQRELAPELQGKGLSYRSPIVRMRQMLDLYICLRPCRAFPGNPLNYREDIDLVVFRENTEGMYIGVEFPRVPESFSPGAGHGADPARRRHLDPQRHAPGVAPHRARGVRVRRQERPPQSDGGAQGQRSARHLRRVSRSRPGGGGRVSRRSDFDTANVDAMGMWLLKNPQNYDVIVTTNLFGDILSDLCAQLVGGMGFAYSGNIGDRYAVFEPTHGSAPKYAGLNKVNPLAIHPGGRR